jgi:hypothetical protein
MLALALAIAAFGCGGDDGGNDDDGDGSDVLRDAVAKTEAAKTARMDITVSVAGERYDGEVLIDFEHDRNHMTMDVEGQTVQGFTDGSDEYIRLGSSGRYQQLPPSEQTPVANNPTDSLQYLGTDVVDVQQSGDEGCYEGELDFDRVFERVEEGREGELPEDLRGHRAPVLVCVDSAGRIRRYDVELSVEGTTGEVRSTLSDYGEVAPLDPLGPDELPP